MRPESWPSNEPVSHMLTRRRLLLAGGALAGALVIGGCGDDDDGDAADDTSGAGEAPEKPDKIIMRSWGDPYSTSLEASAGKSFTAKTGIKVEYDFTDFGEMKAKIEQAIKAGERPFVDVAYTVTPDAYIASLQGYAAPLDLALVPNYNKLTAAGKPDDGTTSWVNIYTYVLPILYRTDLVTLPEAMSLDELWDPKYAGSITLNLDPNLVVWPMSKKMGLNPDTDDLTPLWDRLAELKPNIGAIVTSDTELLELMNAGEVSIAFGLPGNAGFIDNGATKVPTEGAAQSSDAVYVTKGLPDNVTYWAQVFVNEIIEANNQTAFNAAIATVPTNSEATPLESMKGDPAFPFTDEELTKYAVPVVNSIYATHRDEWIEAMTVALQG